MRYYRIDITDATTGGAKFFSSLGNGVPLSSLLPTGGTNMAALQVELDIPVAPMHAPDGTALIRIWGLSIKDLGASFDLNPLLNGKPGALVTVSGGMAQGLPLANPAQAGVLIQGSVLQAYGNWIGVEQTVDIQLAPGGRGSSKFPVNYSLDWKNGTPLADALRATLTTALPNAKLNINISPRLVLNHDQQGYYQSITQLSQLLNELSKSIISDQNYLGVHIVYDGKTVNVNDFTIQGKAPIDIQFTDLIGQPTWIGPLTISVKTVMRADINLLDDVTLPQSQVTSSSAAFQGLTGNNPADDLTFSGPFRVLAMHHYGNFRQPDAASWATVFEMGLIQKQTAATPPA